MAVHDTHLPVAAQMSGRGSHLGFTVIRLRCITVVPGPDHPVVNLCNAAYPPAMLPNSGRCSPATHSHPPTSGRSTWCRRRCRQWRRPGTCRHPSGGRSGTAGRWERMECAGWLQPFLAAFAVTGTTTRGMCKAKVSRTVVAAAQADRSRPHDARKAPPLASLVAVMKL